MALQPGDAAVTLIEGRAPRGPTEVALESATLESSGLSVGEREQLVRLLAKVKDHVNSIEARP